MRPIIIASTIKDMEDKTIRQNQPHIIIKPALIIIFILIIGLGLWLILTSRRSPSKTNVKLPNLASTCKYNDPPICAFINELKTVTDLAIKITLTTNLGEKTTNFFESQDKNRTRFISYNKSGQEISSWIFIDNAVYAKDYTDNRWWKQVVDKTAQEQIATGVGLGTDFGQKAVNRDDKTIYHNLGTEPCGTLVCFKYQVVNPTDLYLKEYIYFDNVKYQLRKLMCEMKDGGIVESIYQYDQTKIVEPSPIKEASPNQNIFIAPGSPLYEEAVQKASDEIIKKMLEQLQNNPPQ